MHDACHAFMNKAGQLEIADSREHHCECLPCNHWRRGNAGGTVEHGAADREPRTTHGKRRTNLSFSEERHSVNLVRLEDPANTVAFVNPDFVGQKRNRLSRMVLCICTHFGLPLSAEGWRQRQYEDENTKN